MKTTNPPSDTSLRGADMASTTEWNDTSFRKSLDCHTAKQIEISLFTMPPPQNLNDGGKPRKEDSESTREVYNALGRRFKVIQRIDDDVLKSIVAFYPQSTIGDKVTQVWYRSETDDDWPDDARVAIDVHDNLVCIASPRTVKTALAIMCKYAEQPIPIRNVFTGRTEELIIPAEAKMSYPVSYVLDDQGKWDYKEDPKGIHRWSHLKKVKL